MRLSVERACGESLGTFEYAEGPGPAHVSEPAGALASRVSDRR